MKKPILDSGSLDASQLGVIGSALLFAYAVGKFVNGFIADYCNIKRFMATGLIVSAAANALMGLMGLAHSVVPTAVIFVAFAVMWGLNGWAQSMGAPPAIISLSRWYPLRERGTYYGFFSASHNLGEFFSFLFVGSIVSFAGWQAGFFGSTVAGAIGVVLVLCWPTRNQRRERTNPFGRFKNKCSAPRRYGCWRRQARSCTYPAMP